MTFDQLINNLQNEFNIDGPHDISMFFAESGEKWLYDFISAHYKSEFSPRERIVLYYKQDDHSLSGEPGRLIKSLQQVIADVDISHNFIILITEDQQVASDASTVRELLSTDAADIAVHVVDSIECAHLPRKTNPNTACVLPWGHVYISTNGSVMPCCDSVRELPIGNVKHNSVNSLLTSDAFNTVRSTMLARERPPECATCYKLEDAGIRSKREHFNELHPDGYNKIINNNTTNMDIRGLDLHLSNTCNFKCRMCTGFSSSKLRAEELVLNTHGETNYTSLSSAELTARINELSTMLDDVDIVSFAGGESLLIAEYNIILEKLLELGKTSTILQYTTNMSMLPAKTVQYWNKFNNIKVIASIDSTGEHAEYYRNGTVWKEVMQNYHALRAYAQVELSINSTFSIYNAFRLIPLQQEWISAGIASADAWKVHTVNSPEYLSVQVLPAMYKERLVADITAHIQLLASDNNSQILIDQWEQILAYLTTDNSHLLPRFFSYTDKLDTHRNENFDSVHPEYAELRKFNQ